MPYGSKATGILPVLSKIALRGNFPLVFDHFISKITDCTQPPENPALGAGFPVYFPRPLPCRPPKAVKIDPAFLIHSPNNCAERSLISGTDHASLASSSSALLFGISVGLESSMLVVAAIPPTVLVITSTLEPSGLT